MSYSPYNTTLVIDGVVQEACDPVPDEFVAIGGNVSVDIHNLSSKRNEDGTTTYSDGKITFTLPEGSVHTKMLDKQVKENKCK